MTRLSRLAPAALACALLLTACGGGGDTPAQQPTPPAPQPVTLSASAAATQLLPGGTAALTASASDNSQVAWQLASGAPGTLSATAGGAVTYTAPAVAVPTPVTITATAGGASKTLQLVVNPDPGPAGLSLLAGSLASQTVVDGTGTAARFARIGDMAVAQDGAVLVADRLGPHPVLRRVSPAAKVTSIPLPTPSGIDMWVARPVAVTPDGVVWTVRETGQEATLLKVDANDSVSAAGASDDRLVGTNRIVSGAAGELIVQAGCAFYRATYQGALSLLAGGPCFDSNGNRPPIFRSVSDVTRAANGALYAVDETVLRRIATDGTVTTITPRDSATGNTIASPTSIAALPDGTFALLAHEQNEQLVYSMKPDGSATPLFRAPIVKTEIGEARGLYWLVRSDASGRLLLATEGEVRVVQNGAAVPLAGMEDDSVANVDGPGPAARFVNPWYIASDLRGNVYVTDNPNGKGAVIGDYGALGLSVRKIDAAGNVTTVLRNREFARAMGIVADQAGNLYVAEMPIKTGRYVTYGGVIRKIAPDGTMTVFAGQLESAGVVDGKGKDARFMEPRFAGIAADGTLYVNDIRTPDQGNEVLRKVAPDGTVTTVAALPDDVGRAPDGKRYGIDGETVYRVEADGTHTVVAGKAGTQGTVLGPLPGGLFGERAALVPTGLYTFALISNSAIVKLVVPH